MKLCTLILSAALFIAINSFSQDTFSIVALDSITGEVGSAGASCVDLVFVGISDATFLGVLVPGVGAVNTQAYYVAENQENTTIRMYAGDTPQEVIDYALTWDATGQPELRQYGVVALVDGSPQTAAFTGDSTDDYKNHILGPNYAIQGNILLGPEVLDQMEAGFLNEDGDLATKLMAAMQGANIVGADSRCKENGTSSMFAYLKVSQATDPPGSPSLMTSVINPLSGIDPIDSLQVLFDLAHDPGSNSIGEFVTFDSYFSLYPNPADNHIFIEKQVEDNQEMNVEIYAMDGKLIQEFTLLKSSEIDMSEFSAGTYLISIVVNGNLLSKKVVKH